MSGVIHVNSLKTAREALCLAEGAVRHIHGPTPRAELIAAMIRDIDEQQASTVESPPAVVQKWLVEKAARHRGRRVR